MRDFLLRLLGAPAPVHIHFDRDAISIAKPGDLLVFHIKGDSTIGLRDSFIKESLPWLKEKAPGVSFFIITKDFDLWVAPISKAGEQQ